MLFAFVELVNHINHLFTKPDGVALRNKHYAVECVGNHKNRAIVAAQVERLLQLAGYCAVGVGAVNHYVRHFLELCPLVALRGIFVGKEQHNLLTPLFEFCRNTFNVVECVVAWFVVWINQAKNVIAATGGREQRLGGFGCEIVVFVFAVEVTYHLHVGLALTNHQLGVGLLVGCNVEEV